MSGAAVRGEAPPPGSLLDTLLRDPGRFSFDAAIGILLAASGAPPDEALRFQTAWGLRPAWRDVLKVWDSGDDTIRRFVVRIGFTGLTGPGGVLPRPYTELVGEEHRRRSEALGTFLDVLSQRALLQYAMAGIKYLPHRTAATARAQRPDERGAREEDPFVHTLLSLAGHGLPGDLERSGLTAGQLLYFSGLFAARPRSADRLAALLEEWLGVEVRIDQFVGVWQSLDPSERSKLGSAFSTLGRDAAAGARVWDIQSRIRIVVGPLGLERFEALLPGGAQITQLERLIRTYLDDEASFAINLVLRADAVPPARTGRARLGWSGWLPSNGPRKTDARETVFTDTGRRL